MAAPTNLKPRAKRKPLIPPLRDGDRLDADEFMRRYEAMPEINKAELIEGVVYMPSPVTTEAHGSPHFDTIGWLSYYRTFTPGVQGADNATVLLDFGNVPQPDVFLRILPSHGGRTAPDPKGYTAGPPELIVEISGRGKEAVIRNKQEAYRRNGVREYLIWRVAKREIEWLALRRGRYTRLKPAAGIYRSEVFPGLWLDVDAILRGDMVHVLGVVQQGLATAEHAAFVTRLQQAFASGERD